MMSPSTMCDDIRNVSPLFTVRSNRMLDGTRTKNKNNPNKKRFFFGTKNNTVELSFETKNTAWVICGQWTFKGSDGTWISTDVFQIVRSAPKAQLFIFWLFPIDVYPRSLSFRHSQYVVPVYYRTYVRSIYAYVSPPIHFQPVFLREMLCFTLFSPMNIIVLAQFLHSFVLFFFAFFRRRVHHYLKNGRKNTEWMKEDECMANR